MQMGLRLDNASYCRREAFGGRGGGVAICYVSRVATDVTSAGGDGYVTISAGGGPPLVPIAPLVKLSTVSLLILPYLPPFLPPGMVVTMATSDAAPSDIRVRVIMNSGEREILNVTMGT